MFRLLKSHLQVKYKSRKEYIYEDHSKINLRLVVKKNLKQRTKLYYMEQLHICITYPHSCHPHLGTCRSVALTFAVPRQRMAPPSYAARV